MKAKHLSLKLLIIIYICLLANQSLFPAETVNDPITNSYIINSLEMETDTIPPTAIQDQGEGEIIFDNSFEESLPKTSNYKERQKKLQKLDKRYHFIEYKVKRNENISTIAKKSGTSSDVLIDINNIKNPGHLKENDILLIPSKKGVFYKIRKGDSLTKISQKFKTEIDIIAEHNNIDGKKIIAGKKIFLPEAVESVKEVTVKNRKNIRKTEVIDKIATIEKNKEDTGKEKITSKKVLLSWPLRGPITSGFGIRTHPFSRDKKFHCGLDIGAEVGSVVRSAGDGTVIFSGWKDTYGNLIVISHKNNYLTIYAHNSKILVDVNEKIRKGQKIALSGKTGAVTGAHLHFEIRKGIVPLNPSRILK